MHSVMKGVLLASLFGLLGCKGGALKGNPVIVVDAGHGGHDPGAVSGGKLEKDVVYQITKRVTKALKSEGFKVYQTRDSDRFLTLSQRTRMADKMGAKAFISIHANAIAQKEHFERVSGIETYFLQKTRDAKSQRIAARENASVLQGADRLSKNVIIDAVLNGPKIIESNKLAIDVQKEMVKQVRKEYSVKNGGVKPAPFYVLVGASRPSILIETGYITNEKERKNLFDEDYQELLAEGIASGVKNYLITRQEQLGF